jgi:hypothetical protein
MCDTIASFQLGFEVCRLVNRKLTEGRLTYLSSQSYRGPQLSADLICRWNRHFKLFKGRPISASSPHFRIHSHPRAYSKLVLGNLSEHVQHLPFPKTFFRAYASMKLTLGWSLLCFVISTTPVFSVPLPAVGFTVDNDAIWHADAIQVRLIRCSCDVSRR